jgi:hypothetical protein
MPSDSKLDMLRLFDKIRGERISRDAAVKALRAALDEAVTEERKALREIVEARRREDDKKRPLSVLRTTDQAVCDDILAALDTREQPTQEEAPFLDYSLEDRHLPPYEERTTQEPHEHSGWKWQSSHWIPTHAYEHNAFVTGCAHDGLDGFNCGQPESAHQPTGGTDATSK